MGPGIWVPHPSGIVLNSGARLGRRVWLFQNVELIGGIGSAEKILIGDGAWLASGAMVIGTAVGEESIVAARAVVTHPVPARHIALGVPATTRPLNPRQLKLRAHAVER